MGYYLYQVSYTPEAWATLVSNPQNRMDAIRPVIENLGGKLECMFFAFGECDVVAIVQMPDSESAAAFSIVGAAGGAVKSIKTTPLLTVAEAIGAMRKAGESDYKPPGS